MFYNCVHLIFSHKGIPTLLEYSQGRVAENPCSPFASNSLALDWVSCDSSSPFSFDGVVGSGLEHGGVVAIELR